MITKALTIVLIIFGCNVKGQMYGGSKDDSGVSFCVRNNGFSLLGVTRSYGAGSDDIWLLTLNEEHDVINSFEYGYSTYDVASSIIQTHDDQIVYLGYSWAAPGPGFRGDLVINKENQVGNIQWTTYLGGLSNDYPTNIIETCDKGYVMTGVIEAFGTLGSAFLYKLNENGTIAWQKYYDTNEKDMGMDVVQCPDSSFLILANKAAFHGLMANSNEYKSSEPTQMMLIKTDKLGNEVWKKYYGGSDYNFASEIVTNGKDYYFLGSTKNGVYGSFDMVVYKVDQDGNELWKKYYGGSDYDYGNSIAINDNGNLLIVGSSSSDNISSDSDIYFAILDSSGTIIKEEYINHGASDYGEECHFLPNNEFAIIGTSQSATNGKELYFQKFDSTGKEILVTGKFSVDTDRQAYKIFPNPVSDHLFVEVSAELAGNSTFLLFDLRGKKIFEMPLHQKKNSGIINRSIARGSYIFRIVSDDKSYGGKIIVN